MPLQPGQFKSGHPFSGIIVTILWALAGCSPAPVDTLPEMVDPLELHQAILTLDSHVDTPLRILREGIDLGQRHDPREYSSKLDLPRMDEGGLDAVFFAVWTAQGARTDSGHAAVKAQALNIIKTTREMVLKYPEQMEMATTAEDASHLAAIGKHAIYLGMENGYPIGNDLHNLDLFYQEGVRYLTLCHTSNNDICDSSMDSTEFGGLSSFGFDVVKRMNDLGMMVDISHVSDASVRDVLRTSRAPVIASHSCARALCGHVRNLNDSLLTAIARQGGVIQLALFSEYLVDEVPNPQRDSARAVLKEKWGDTELLDLPARAQYRKERRLLNETYPRRLPGVADAVDHIDHIVAVAGIDHVGIGSDFDGGAELQDCYDVSQIPNITRELLKRGYSREDIQKIWSGNLLRVFAEVERLAQR